MYTELPKS
jgi:hypothetical protein